METGRHLRNVRRFLPDYTASYARTLRSLSELLLVRHVANIYETNRTLLPAPEQICTARSMTSCHTARKATEMHICTAQPVSLPSLLLFFLPSFVRYYVWVPQEISFTRLRLVYLTTLSNFDVLLTMHLSIILVINQLNAQNLVDMNMSYRLAFCKTIAQLMSHNNRRQLPRRK